MVAFFTSHDRAISEPLGSAGKSARRYPGFAEALAAPHGGVDGAVARVRHDAARERARPARCCGSTSRTSCRSARATRPTTTRACRPAGLNGEAYRGHVFWDELLHLPVPELPAAGDHPRAAHVPLPAARRGARGGARGRLPGRHVPVAERQRRHRGDPGRPPQPAVGPVGPRPSHNQRHVNAAIFYNIWQYYQATDDLEFLRDYGAEMMLEIARFWASIAHYNPERDRYEIHGVMGPDEFHEKYPGAAEGGLRNNAYTNVMVAWIADTAPRVLGHAARQPARRAARPARARPTTRSHAWEEMSRKMFVPVPRRRHHQPVRGLRGPRGARLGRLPRQARQHPAPRPHPAGRGRRSRPLQAGQAGRHGDAVLPVLRRRAASACSSGSATPYDPMTRAARNIDYYDQRTSHGSTLSFIAHAGVLAGARPRAARGSGSSSRWRATSATSRAARPRRASTSASCAGRST